MVQWTSRWLVGSYVHVSLFLDIYAPNLSGLVVEEMASSLVFFNEVGIRNSLLSG